MALLAALTCGVLALTCGGGDKSAESTPSSGGDSAKASELSGTDSLTVSIELDTSLEPTYYDVEGITTESIFNHIERNGPTDADGKRGSGLTSVVWGYEWQGGSETGVCTIDSMTIKAEMVVTLPAHLDTELLPSSIRDDWDAYAESVAVHEQTHVDIYEDGAGTIRERMLAMGPLSDCDNLEAEIERVWSEAQAEINDQQAEFHQQEFERLALLRQPLAAQIDASRAEINSLQVQISGLDTEITDLRAELNSLLFEISDIDQEIKAVNDSNESQADKQAKLTVLIQQRNSLQARHNEAVDEHNDALAQRELLVSKRDQLIDETNALVDEFNWTR